MNEVKPSRRPSPLPYHLAIRDYLKNQESELWNWYASNRVKDEQADAIRFELLKSTYRIDLDSQPDLYKTASQIARNLELDVPITLYQVQKSVGLNASIAIVPNEAHIVFHGPLTSRFAAEELSVLLAHELGHLLLFKENDGDFLIAEQVLAAMTHDRNAQHAHLASARLFDLYTEIYCDRVALSQVNSPAEVISAIVKLETDLERVDAASYLKQAEEILSQGSVKSEGVNHPESYIRALAVRLWHDEDPEADAQISELIEGQPTLDHLDLLAQQQVNQTTRELIQVMLGPAWMRSDLLLAHARLYFADFQPQLGSLDELKKEISRCDQGLHDYYCYVLLDFVTADRDLEEAPLAHAIGIAERIDLAKRFAEIAVKELRLRKRQYEKIVTERDKLMSLASKKEASR